MIGPNISSLELGWVGNSSLRLKKSIEDYTCALSSGQPVTHLEPVAQ